MRTILRWCRKEFKKNLYLKYGLSDASKKIYKKTGNIIVLKHTEPKEVKYYASTVIRGMDKKTLID